MIRGLVLAGVALALLGTAAPAQEPVRRLITGDAARGAEIIRATGCVACHVIPGIRGRSGSVGPSLEGLVRRAYIAGALPNRPDALVAFIVDPPSLAPGTAMPPLGLTPAEARDVAAYLYGQR